MAREGVAGNNGGAGLASGLSARSGACGGEGGGVDSSALVSRS